MAISIALREEASLLQERTLRDPDHNPLCLQALACANLISAKSTVTKTSTEIPAPGQHHDIRAMAWDSKAIFTQPVENVVARGFPRF